jgi:hypothetical protein
MRAAIVDTGQVAAVIGSCGIVRQQVSEKKLRLPSCALVASIGNYRANAIPENEPNYEPDCESHFEFRHDIFRDQQGAHILSARSQDPHPARCSGSAGNAAPPQ